MKTLKHLVVILAASFALPLSAHVSVAPTQSKPASPESYSFRVPSEGGRTTTGVVLTVPAGVTIVSLAVPTEGGGVNYVRKTDGQPDQVVWTIEIKPGATVQLSLTANNPGTGDSIGWKVEQKYADGTSSTWNPRTTLGAAAGAQPAAH